MDLKILVCFGLFAGALGSRWGAEGNRPGHGRRDVRFATAINASTLSSWGVPPDAEILIESEESCSGAPSQYHASLALMCEFANRLQMCVDVSETSPLLTGTHCSGQSCIMELNVETSACFLMYYGINVNPNATQTSPTCGLNASDADWLTPSSVPIGPTVYGTEICTMTQVEGVQSKVWVECTSGKALVRMKLTFDVEMPKQYTCLVNPTCQGPSHYVSQFVCYTIPLTKGLSEVDRISDSANRCVRRGKMEMIWVMVVLVCLMLA